MKWLRPVADNLLKRSLTEAAVPVLEELTRREEENQEVGDELQPSFASNEQAMAVAKSREQCTMPT